MGKVEIKFNINGEDKVLNVAPHRRLIDMLREDLSLTSVKEGCGEGECGACTIILDGRAVTSCTMLAPQVDGSEVITLEGLSKDGELDDLQDAFLEAGAVQCGFCTPAMILSTKALLMENPDPSEEDIKRSIAGNICRCTGYKKIVDAVELTLNK